MEGEGTSTMVVHVPEGEGRLCQGRAWYRWLGRACLGKVHVVDERDVCLGYPRLGYPSAGIPDGG